METAELKNLLKLKFDAIQDNDYLNALNILVETKTENIIILSEEQKMFLNKSQKEYSEGNYFENNHVNEDIEKWISEE